MAIRAGMTSARLAAMMAGEMSTAPRAAATALYVGGIVVIGGALFVALAPRTYPNPYLALGLLCTALALAVFKLRLPLANGVSTLTLTCVVDFVALLVSGVNLAMV